MEFPMHELQVVCRVISVRVTQVSTKEWENRKSMSARVKLRYHPPTKPRTLMETMIIGIYCLCEIYCDAKDIEKIGNGD